MFASRRQILLIVAVCLVAPITGSARAGYLAVVGPVPLRFLAIVQPVTNLVVVPPTPPEPPPSQVEKVTNTPPSAVTVEVKSPVVPVTNSVPAVTVVPPIAPVISAPQSDEVVSPQMLLKYFNKSTNGTTTGVIAPIDFNPPRPVQLPSSKATYSVTP